ncbi:MAG: hypothetical protein ACHRXM_16375 [Isosphaerales bacterium]
MAKGRLAPADRFPRKGDYQMATERLKFRCYRCNQLLAVAPSKAGTVVSCPKCQADLLIPGGEPRAKGDGENRAKGEVESRTRVETEAPARREGEPRARAEAAAILGLSPAPPKPAPVPVFMGEIAGVIPPDLADLRPEDLRVEAEFFENLTRLPAPATTVEPTHWLVPEAISTSYSSEPLSPPAPNPPGPEPLSEMRPSESFSVPPETADRVPGPSERPSRPDEVSSIGAHIEIEPPSILPPGAEIRRVSEVVLPASVVLAWSLFVLAGIAAAFVAGLMMGHFLWKTH